jgi:hypothetical protein
MSISHWGMFFGYHEAVDMGRGSSFAVYRPCTPEMWGW